MNPELTHLSQVSARGVIPGIKKNVRKQKLSHFDPVETTPISRHLMTGEDDGDSRNSGRPRTRGKKAAEGGREGGWQGRREREVF